MLIRSLRPDDVESVVQLSLRAWAPVFESIERAMGPELYQAFHPEGWRVSQASAVESVCTSGAHSVWVAVESGGPVGFVAVALRVDEGIGEIYMVAVDPDHQGRGVGMALTEHAVARMREEGIPIAMVETGGDPGHAPARALYERAGFRSFPTVKYFRKL